MNEVTTMDDLRVQERIVERAAGAAIAEAVRMGEMLLALKDNCPHGAFQALIEQNLKTSYTQCKKYMQVAKSPPAGFLSLPSIDSIVELLAASDSVQDTVKQRLDDGEEVTRAEIRKLKEAEAEARMRADDWRSQAMTERDAKRAAEKALEDERTKPAQVAFVDDAGEATKELQAQLLKLKAENKKLHEDKMSALAKARAELDKAESEKAAAVLEKSREIIAGRDERANKLQEAIVAREARIKALNEKMEALEVGVGDGERHASARKAVTEQMVAIAVEVMLIDDEDVSMTEHDFEAWASLLGRLNGFAVGYLERLK